MSETFLSYTKSPELRKYVCTAGHTWETVSFGSQQPSRTIKLSIDGPAYCMQCVEEWLEKNIGKASEAT